MSLLIKELVSKNKRRFVNENYNLDLSYINNNIIAMGFPSERIEGIYRNRIQDVSRFMEQYHKGHYKIYNLRRDGTYDESKFNGRVVHYPMDDHHPPTLHLMRPFCDDVHRWLMEDDSNVVAVHCKAGKGRTGVMICAYLLYCQQFSRPIDALTFYGDRRARDMNGVTIPSQRRYVEYFNGLLITGRTPTQVTMMMRSVQLQHAQHDRNKLQGLSFDVYCAGKRVYKSGVYNTLESGHGGTATAHSHGPQGDQQHHQSSAPSLSTVGTTAVNGAGVAADMSYVLDTSGQCLSMHIPADEPAVHVAGDVRVDVFHKQNRLKKEKLFHFWFNTYFVCPGVESPEKLHERQTQSDDQHQGAVVSHIIMPDDEHTPHADAGGHAHTPAAHIAPGPSSSSIPIEYSTQCYVPPALSELRATDQVVCLIKDDTQPGTATVDMGQQAQDAGTLPSQAHDELADDEHYLRKRIDTNNHKSCCLPPRSNTCASAYQASHSQSAPALPATNQRTVHFGIGQSDDEVQQVLADAFHQSEPPPQLNVPPGHHVLSLRKAQLDRACKDTKHQRYPHDMTVHVVMRCCDEYDYGVWYMQHLANKHTLPYPSSSAQPTNQHVASDKSQSAPCVGTDEATVKWSQHVCPLWSGPQKAQPLRPLPGRAAHGDSEDSSDALVHAHSSGHNIHWSSDSEEEYEDELPANTPCSSTACGSERHAQHRDRDNTHRAPGLNSDQIGVAVAGMQLHTAQSPLSLEHNQALTTASTVV